MITIVGVALVFGVCVPVGFMFMLAPSLAQAGTRPNYRGKPVYLGLGVVWLIWAVGAVAGGSLVATISDLVMPRLISVAGFLALTAFAFGMVDDALGTTADRGFRGHLSALAHGRLTTGGLKLLGIGASSLGGALLAADHTHWGGKAWSPGWFANVLAAGAAIALTANLINLTDLRPGRALKVYGLLGVVGTYVAAFMLEPAAGAGADVGPALAPLFELMPASASVSAKFTLLYILGPILATWRFDVGEAGMLGDAGANPMGAVAGFVFVSGLGASGLWIYLAVVFALNLASERVSFSRVIESRPVLRWIDGLGRKPHEEDAPEQP